MAKSRHGTNGNGLYVDISPKDPKALPKDKAK